MAMLATLVEEWGGEVSVTERVPDTSDALLRAVSRAIVAADLLLTSGRISPAPSRCESRSACRG